MMRRIARYWTPIRVMDLSILLGIVFVVVWELHPNLIFSSTLITGGDTGSHLALPAYLRTQGNLFDFTPWYPGWFAGMPAYSYYFVLPDILATWASYLIGFAVAMKLATILGSVLMPFSAYAMGRLFRAPDGATGSAPLGSVSCSPRTSCPGSSRSRRWLSSWSSSCSRGAALEIPTKRSPSAAITRDHSDSPLARVCCRSRSQPGGSHLFLRLSVTPTHSVTRTIR